jgi:6-phosphofructokinase 2
MILTLTPNPSLDLLFETDQLVWDDANRMADPRRRPGGQGINVARAVRVLGGDAAVLTLLGGRTGEEIEHALRAEGIRVHAARSASDTRTFVAVRETVTGRSMLLNARGPARCHGDADALLALLERVLQQERPTWLACCGSVPSGFPADFHARAAALARSAGVCVVVDCDGEALRAAADMCDLLVPNHHEAERLTGITINDMRSAHTVARTMLQGQARRVAVTLGDAGAILASQDGVWLARAPALTSGSAVGAGDTFLGALLRHDDLSDEEALRHAVAAGSAALLSRGSDLITAEDAGWLIEHVRVERLEG